MATPRSSTPATSAHEQQAESSKGVAPSPDSATSFALAFSGYVFNAGFCHQQWADVQVSFFGTSLRLHRLILARSPYLARLLANSMPGGSVQLLFTDENITEEAVYIAIQHLYNPSLHLVSPANARAVLATACLFGAMADLEEKAYSVIASSISASNVGDLVLWLSASSRPATNGFAYGGPGVQMPHGHGHSHSPSVDSWGAPPLYGPWTERLRDDISTYLVRTLPAQLASEPNGTAQPQPPHLDPRLQAAYVPLPYDLFKACTESPELPIPFIQDRFAFANRVIAARKKRAVAEAQAAGATGAQFEEGVVLALKTDGGDGMTVHITRKPKRSRGALWKVEG